MEWPVTARGNSRPRAAAAWPLMTALSIVAGRPGVDPVACEEQPGHPVAHGRPRRAAWRHAKTSPRLSRTTTARRGRLASRAAGARRPQLAHRQRDQLLVAPRDNRLGSARDQRQVRAPSPNSTRLSNTHCIIRPGRPTNVASVTGRSNHRLTVTIGDAAWLAPPRTRRQRRRLGPERGAQGVPRHGADDGARARSRGRRSAPTATRRATRRSPAARPVSHGAAARLDERARQASRTARPAAPLRAPAPTRRGSETCGRSTAANGAAAAHVDRLVQRGNAPAAPRAAR